MEPIKLYTSRNCPVCEQVKVAIKDLPHEILSVEDNMDDLIEELNARRINHREIRQAPAMIVPGCDLIWTGEDCLIAIEEKEWE